MLCFVDFSTPGQSTLALDALQGEHDILNSLLTSHFYCQINYILFSSLFLYFERIYIFGSLLV